MYSIYCMCEDMHRLLLVLWSMHICRLSLCANKSVYWEIHISEYYRIFILFFGPNDGGGGVSGRGFGDSVGGWDGLRREEEKNPAVVVTA